MGVLRGAVSSGCDNGLDVVGKDLDQVLVHEYPQGEVFTLLQVKRRGDAANPQLFTFYNIALYTLQPVLLTSLNLILWFLFEKRSLS